ncbi:MAG: RadC family protein [Janthinobacterium lividum]
MSEENTSIGHRGRLRERFLKGGEDALAPYEFIEMHLYGINARRDMKPLAKRLLTRFGTTANVFNACEEDLLKIEGVGPSVVAVLKLVQVTAHRIHREAILNQNITQISTWREVLDYCEITMSHLTREQVRLLFLDKHLKLIAEDVQMLGSIDHAPVYVREIVNKAVNVGASGMIMVHNHPSGDPTPSESDISTTITIRDTSILMGITLYDHIIIGKGVHTSLKAKGLM